MYNRQLREKFYNDFQASVSRWLKRPDDEGTAAICCAVPETTAADALS
jgi:hypothetical protein